MPSNDFPANPRGFDHLEDSSSALRKRLGFEHVLRLDMLEVVQRCGRHDGPVPGLKISVVSDDDMPDDDAIAKFDPPEIVIKSSWFVALQNGDPDASDLVAHELAHIILHPGATKHRNVGGTKHLQFLPAYKRVEWQADAWGDCFKAPKHLVSKKTTLDDLEQKIWAWHTRRTKAP